MIEQELFFTAVDHRDGEQQHIELSDEIESMNERIDERIAVFDAIISMGVDVIEVGHLGNETDQQFIRALIEHIQSNEGAGETKYEAVKLQVLLGSQTEIITDSLHILEGISNERVVVHVYDRLADSLRAPASESYTQEDSANRIVDVAQIAIENGYKNLSISGEGASAESVDDAVAFYRSAAIKIMQAGAINLNINFANTFGFSPVGEWDQSGLAEFNRRVKKGLPTTTSVHTHDDMHSSAEFSLAAVRAGFDRVEGTVIGMGERSGNVSIVDVVARLLEDAQSQVLLSERGKQARGIGISAVDWNQRFMSKNVVDALPHMYSAAKEIANIYGVQDRFRGTILGSPHVFSNGSGPHDQLAARGIEDPLKYPVWRAYGSQVPPFAIMGRPEAQAIMRADPNILQAITVGGHAGGGNTTRILENQVIPAQEVERAEAEQIAAEFMAQIVGQVSRSTS